MVSGSFGFLPCFFRFRPRAKSAEIASEPAPLYPIAEDRYIALQSRSWELENPRARVPLYLSLQVCYIAGHLLRVRDCTRWVGGGGY
jgi:hypothetical protein